MSGRDHKHYFFPIPKGITEADIYRLIEMIGITCPVAQHVFKKSAAAGQRGHKDLRKDWQDILDSAKRKLEMLDEDERAAEISKREGSWFHADIGVSDSVALATVLPGGSFSVPIASPYQGITLPGHELNTDFDSEHRMEQIGPNGNEGEHYGGWIPVGHGMPELPLDIVIQLKLASGVVTPGLCYRNISRLRWEREQLDPIVAYRVTEADANGNSL